MAQLVYVEKAYADDREAQEKRIAARTAELVHKQGADVVAKAAPAKHSAEYERELSDPVGSALVDVLRGTVKKADGPSHEHEHAHLSAYGYSYSHVHPHDHRDGIEPDSKAHDTSETAHAHQHVSKADAARSFDEYFSLAMQRDAQPVRKATTDRYGVDFTDSQRFRYGQYQ
jgi:hypothetical protein